MAELKEVRLVGFVWKGSIRKGASVSDSYGWFRGEWRPLSVVGEILKVEGGK